MSEHFGRVLAGFAEPPRSYGPTPFWWWSGEPVTAERVRWQMEQFRAGGVRELVLINLAPTGPMYGADPDQPAWRSESWWSLLEGCCDDAEELGMGLYLYDQIGFSSGGVTRRLVEEDPTRAGHWLGRCSSPVIRGSVASLLAPPGTTPLAAWFEDASGTTAAVQLDDHGGASYGGTGELHLAYVRRRGYDWCSAAAAAALLQDVHGQIEARLARHLGTVILGTFQDELPSVPTWADGFERDYRARFGESLPIRCLWGADEGSDQSATRHRRQFHALRAELAETAWFRPHYDWHSQRGLLSGCDQQGPAREGHPSAAVECYGDYLRTHRWFTAPGSDHHGDGRLHASLAHVHRRSRVWLEGFHSAGWGVTPEELADWLVPWLRAGVTLWNPHAAYYSTKQGRFEWAPPSTCWRNPWWPHHGQLAAAVSRWCWMLSQGHHVCDVTVLHPTTTAQGAWPLDRVRVGDHQRATSYDALPAGTRAAAVYEALVGSMYWELAKPGALEVAGWDFDIIDDAAIASASVAGDRLACSEERYRAVIVPACTQLLPATAAVLADMAAAGGTVIAVAPVSASLASRPGVIIVAEPDQVATALATVTRSTIADRVVLRRRIGDLDVLLVPARPATKHHGAGFLAVDYSFDPTGYDEWVTVSLAGAHGTAELWDPTTGERTALAHRHDPDGRFVLDVPLDGPAALVVVGVDPSTPPSPGRAPTSATGTVIELPTVWTADLEATVKDPWHDLGLPGPDDPFPVQTWAFDHDLGDDRWTRVTATTGIGAVAERLDRSEESWPLRWSATRGVARDPVHRTIPQLGPKGHVPEAFWILDDAEPGTAFVVRTRAVLDAAFAGHLAVGADAELEVSVDGRRLEPASPEPHWRFHRVELSPGTHDFEIRLTAITQGALRVAAALVVDVDAFRRPEWLAAPSPPRSGSTVRFERTLVVQSPSEANEIHAAADSRFRVLVDGVEVAREGGFDSYDDAPKLRHRVASARIGPLGAGPHAIAVEVEDPGRPVACLFDSLLGGSEVTSDGTWSVRRDGEALTEAPLRRQPFLDPPWVLRRRRPHPLPHTRWIETADPDPTSAVLDVAWHAPTTAGLQRLRWRIPPGATEATIALAKGVGEVALDVDGIAVTVGEDGSAALAHPTKADRVATLVARQPAAWCSEGALLAGPITYRGGTGRMSLGSWAERGLATWPGAVRYRATFIADAKVAAHTAWTLDLGRVRGTAEVTVNGELAGVRIWAPWRFAVGELIRPGSNQIEVRVCGTLDGWFRWTSPTPFVFPGQDDCGLHGPVVLRSS